MREIIITHGRGSGAQKGEKANHYYAPPNTLIESCWSGTSRRQRERYRTRLVQKKNGEFVFRRYFPGASDRAPDTSEKRGQRLSISCDAVWVREKRKEVSGGVLLVVPSRQDCHDDPPWRSFQLSPSLQRIRQLQV